MPSVSTPESSNMRKGIDGMGSGGGEIGMSPNGSGWMNGNGIGKRVNRTRTGNPTIGRMENPNDKNGDSTKQTKEKALNIRPRRPRRTVTLESSHWQNEQPLFFHHKSKTFLVADININIYSRPTPQIHSDIRSAQGRS
jgi:hypothetical protein